jgi:hypothetical protein
MVRLIVKILITEKNVEPVMATKLARLFMSIISNGR